MYIFKSNNILSLRKISLTACLYIKTLYFESKHLSIKFYVCWSGNNTKNLLKGRNKLQKALFRMEKFLQLRLLKEMRGIKFSALFLDEKIIKV